MSGGFDKYEEAADLYREAANGFRLQRDALSAGQAYEKAAEALKKSEIKDSAASALVDAYKSYRKEYPQDAARVLQEAINLFTKRGGFRRAADYEMDLGAIYETDLKDLDGAITAYGNAGEWYYQDNAEALSNKAFLKLADIAALNGDYRTSYDKLEQVAKNSLNNSLSKWSLKDYFLKAGLCHLAENDMVASEKAVEQYIDMDPSFASTREYKLLEALIQACKDGDEQAFTNSLWEYDQFNKLDNWKVSITLKIKEQIQNAEDDLL